jgi:hypothetical protein
MDRKSFLESYSFILNAMTILVFSLFSSTSFAKNVSLGWDPNPEPDVEGYVVYRNVGSPGPPYKYADTLPEADLVNPLNPMVTITGLKENIEYYVAVTAYDTEGNESNYSDDVCLQIINSAVEVCNSATFASSSGGGGGSSGGKKIRSCFISATGPQTAKSLTEQLSPLQPYKAFSAVLILLLLLAAAKFILFRNINRIAT